MQIAGKSGDNDTQNRPVMPYLTAAATMIASVDCEGCSGTTFDSANAKDFSQDVLWFTRKITPGGNVRGRFGTGTFGFNDVSGDAVQSLPESIVTDAEFLAISKFNSQAWD